MGGGIPSELVARIHSFSTAEGMSQFEVYLAAFVGMLSEDIGGKGNLTQGKRSCTNWRCLEAERVT